MQQPTGGSRTGTREALVMAPRLAILLMAALMLGACAAMEGERSAASNRAVVARFPHSTANADCFFQQRIDNFEVLNDSNLLVFDGRRRAYHVELSPPSVDLRHAYGIGFSTATGRVCGHAGERLQIRTASFSRFPPSVVGVYRLDETMQAAVRAHFGQAAAPPALPEDQDADAAEELVTDLEGPTGAAPTPPAETGQEN